MSEPAPGDRKAALRRELRDEDQRFSPAEHALASAQICQRLEEENIWRRAQSILFYYPRPDEPDTHRLFAAAIVQGKAAALPRYSSKDGHYLACLVGDLEKDLRPGAFGIQEPNSRCPIFDLKKLDLVLVPGIGFAPSGFRLGRGKGYYDRLLAEIAGIKCGLAFDWQMTIEIPTESHDICLDCILTPTRRHLVTGRYGL